MTTIVQVKDARYQIGRLSAMQQFHLARRLAPVLAAMGISMAQLQRGGTADLSDFTEMLGPVADVLAKMSDEDANYIIYTALGVVTREQGPDKWAQVCVQSNMMFADIQMPEMLRLVVETLQVNLLDFLQGLGVETGSPSSLAADQPVPATSG
jgi:hypothetical protein